MYIIGSIRLDNDPSQDRTSVRLALANPPAGLSGNLFAKRAAAVNAIHVLGVDAQPWPRHLLQAMGLWADDHLREIAHVGDPEMIYTL